MLQKIKKFFGEARQELRHVNWPTRDEAMRLTGIVIGISVGLALFLGLFDFIFAGAVKNIVLDSAPALPAIQGEESAPALSPGDIEAVTEEGAPVGVEVEPAEE